MEREFLMRVSYMEIYNEKVTDLLSSEEKMIRIYEDTVNMILLKNTGERFFLIKVNLI